MPALDFDLETQVPEPPGGSWETGANGFAANAQ